MKNKEKIQKYLTAIYQNTSTAIQSIEDILPKVIDNDLKDELNSEKCSYERIAERCKDFAKENNLEIKDNNFFEKARLWTTIKMSTLANNQTRHIAEMMLFGTNMGIITCYKDKYDHRNTNEELDKIIEQLENIEIKFFSNLKPFLNVNEN